MRLKIVFFTSFISSIAFSQEDSTAKFDLDNSVIDGQVSFINEDYKNAIKLFDKGLKKNPKNATLSYLLTKSYLLNNQINDAQIISSSNLNSSNNRYLKEAQVETFMMAENFDLAINLLNDLVNNNKENSGYQLKLAEALFENNEIKKCILALENFQKQFGFDTEGNKLLLKAYLKNGDKKKAIPVSLELVEANPFDLNFLNSFVKLCSDEKQNELAERILKSNIDNFVLKNESLALLKEFQVVSLVQDDNLYSLEEIKGIISERPDLVDYQKLVQSSLKILEQVPNQAEARIALIFGYTGKKEFELALKNANDLITEDKANFGNWFILLNAYNEKGDYKSLEKYAMEALEYFPNQYEFWKFLGIAQQKLGKNAEAIKSFEESLSLLYDSPSEKSKINLLLADSLKSIGEDQKAKEILESNN